MLLGIRIVCVPLVLAVLYNDYRHESWIGVIGDLAMFAVIGGLSYSSFQGNKLADENIRKAGLTPDRDEAPPSV